MEDREAVSLGRRLVYRADRPPCEMDVVETPNGDYIGYRGLASNPVAVPLRRMHGEFYENRRNTENAWGFKQGERVRLHVKGPYECNLNGNRTVILNRVYDVYIELGEDGVRFSAYGITDEIHGLLIEKQRKGEVLFERISRLPRHQ
jgi:hypothetical protein